MLDKDVQIKELTKLNEELENYFRNTIIPQLFVDADFILRKFTPPAMKQFSLTENDLGKHLEDIKDNVRFPSIIENIQHVVDTDEILEKEIQTKDFRWFQMNIIPYITIKDKKANGVIVTFVDITARIRDLKEHEKLIAEHETLLDTISHDLKNPLTSILLTVEMLKNVKPEKKKAQVPLLGILANSITKMQTVLHELTESRKLEHEIKNSQELINIEHILEDVRLIIATNIMESGALIKSDIAVSEMFYSRRKLRSIIYNLVSNAIKFRSPYRKLEILIKTTKEGDFVVISVSDNGIGIEADKHENVFSKYARMEKSIEGTGIGLYLVREFVNNAGGKIELTSSPDKGSEFKVYLKGE